MVRTYRVGVVGMVHDHVWGLLRSWEQLPNVTIAAAADPHEELRARIKAEYGVGALYETYDEMFEREDLDIVSCTTENARHAEVVEAAAARGLHALVEKPMAASLAQAERMVAAASFAGVKLFLNWPSSWQPPLQHAIKLAREGFIGQVYEARYRGGHTGPRDLGCSPYFYSWLYDAELNGGGASADYLGYGTGFVYDVLGMPSAVVGLAGRLVQDYITVDDNARLLLEYHRAMALVEGSWTQARPLPGAAAICGTEGNLVIEYGGELTLYRRGVPEPEAIAAPPLPEGSRSGPEAFLGAIMRDEPITGPSSPLRGTRYPRGSGGRLPGHSHRAESIAATATHCRQRLLTPPDGRSGAPWRPRPHKRPDGALA